MFTDFNTLEPNKLNKRRVHKKKKKKFKMIQFFKYCLYFSKHGKKTTVNIL